METKTQNSTAALINLSTLTQYFIPFGNFLFPIIIWSTTKDRSEYVSEQGRQTINFQLSLFLYTFIIGIIAIPIILITFFSNVSFNAIINDDALYFENFDFSNITGTIVIAAVAVVLFCLMKIAEFFLIIYASIKTSNGDDYKYPLTISFIK